MRTLYPAGFDFGNSESCLVTYDAGVKRALSIPSSTAIGTLTELEHLGVLLGPHDFVYRDSTGEQYVGELALEQAAMSFSGRGDISRYWSRKSLQLLLTLAGALIDDMDFDLHLVTGLPVATYLSDPEARDRVKDALSGEHHFWLNGFERYVSVSVERVLMEGAGAAIAYGVRDGLQAVIDIGGRTIDLYVADGQRPLRHLCEGRALGVEMAADLMSSAFERRYARPLSVKESRAILRAYASHGAQRYPAVYVSGELVEELAPFARQSLETIGSEIVSFIASKLNTSESGQVASSFRSVLVIGGGAYYFADKLRRLIPNARVVSAPEQANALGYSGFALSTLPMRGATTHATR